MFKWIPRESWEVKKNTTSEVEGLGTAGEVAISLLVPLGGIAVLAHHLTNDGKSTVKSVTTEKWVKFDIYRKTPNGWVLVTTKEVKVDQSVQVGVELGPDGDVQTLGQGDYSAEAERERQENEIFNNFADEYLEAKSKAAREGKRESDATSDFIKEHKAGLSVQLWAADIEPDDGKVQYALLPAIESTGAASSLYRKEISFLTPGEDYTYEQIKGSLYITNRVATTDGTLLNPNGKYRLVSIEPAGARGRVRTGFKTYTVPVDRLVRAYFLPLE